MRPETDARPDSGCLRWYAVTEQLPHYSGTYLICFRNDEEKHFLLTTRFSVRHQAFGMDDDTDEPEQYAIRTVTHWMPLPEPPGIRLHRWVG